MNNVKIIEQINTLKEKTQGKKIPWKFVNQNLIRWTKEDGARNFITTLQVLQMAAVIRSGEPVTINKNYVLTIQATSPNEVLLQVNTSIEPSLKENMEQLFTEAMAVSQDTSAEVIDKLLKGL